MKTRFRKKNFNTSRTNNRSPAREETSDEEGGMGAGVAQVSAARARAECWRGEGGEGGSDS